MRKCETCDGTGEVEGFVDVVDRYWGHDTKTVWAECDDCKGVGEVETDWIDDDGWWSDAMEEAGVMR